MTPEEIAARLADLEQRLRDARGALLALSDRAAALRARLGRAAAARPPAGRTPAPDVYAAGESRADAP